MNTGNDATIVNDRFWLDSSGTPIYSQGGGALQVGDTYYWYGVNYGGAATYAANPEGKNSDSSSGITAYSSKDLVQLEAREHDTPANTGGWFGAWASSTTRRRRSTCWSRKGRRPLLRDQRHAQRSVRVQQRADQPARIVERRDGRSDGRFRTTTAGLPRQLEQQWPQPTATCLRCGRRTSSPPRTRILVYRGGGARATACSSTRHILLLLVRSARLERLADLLRIGQPTSGPWSAEFVLDGTQRGLQPRHADRFLHQRQGQRADDHHLRRRSLERLRRQRLGFNQWMPLEFQGDKVQLSFTQRVEP